MVPHEGRYIYGVAASERAVNLGPIGIENNEVYTAPHRGLCAIVHNCPAEPYRSADTEIVGKWALSHQDVLDRAQQEFGTVIPLSFDTVLKPKDRAASPDQAVTDWLKIDYERLQSIVEKIAGKNEYGVQIIYEPAVIAKRISEESTEIRSLREEMAAKSPGMAYLYQQKVEKAVRAEIDRFASDWFEDFYARVKRHCDAIVVGKTKKADRNKVMLLNLSCLVARERVDNLGEELEAINKMMGCSVHFSGPWPPYSFVARPVVLVEEAAP
ncbi:MAG: GvpL/GvpF family gas vesicle protein [Chloroflexi bacterium]|nr:GvpL/GvpF family gas vesicle protein [Chloroflexota bacterium]